MQSDGLGAQSEPETVLGMRDQRKGRGTCRRRPRRASVIRPRGRRCVWMIAEIEIRHLRYHHSERLRKMQWVQTDSIR